MKKEYIDTLADEINKNKGVDKIFFSLQNEEIIIREYKNLRTIKKRDIYGYINFEIGQDMPIDLEDYIVKYKILSKNKNTMDLQVILFPKYIEQIFIEIIQKINIKKQYLYINFDVLQRLISLGTVDLYRENCFIIENLKDQIILNSIENKAVQSSNVFEKEEGLEYINNFINEDIHILYYGIEDDFIKKLENNKIDVDRLELNLNVNIESNCKSVDNCRHDYIIHIGMVI